MSQIKRIAAIECEEEGLAAAVWLSHDKMTDVITMYDCCKFNAEVPVVIAEGMNARGRWIPIAWHKDSSSFSKALQDKGCNMLYDGYEESRQMAEMVSREIEERMRTGRFKVERRLAEWLKEFEIFGKESGKIPKAGYPLMAATRYAIASLHFAKRMQQVTRPKMRQCRIAMI